MPSKSSPKTLALKQAAFKKALASKKVAKNKTLKSGAVKPSSQSTSGSSIMAGSLMTSGGPVKGTNTTKGASVPTSPSPPRNPPKLTSTLATSKVAVNPSAQKPTPLGVPRQKSSTPVSNAQSAKTSQVVVHGRTRGVRSAPRSTLPKVGMKTSGLAPVEPGTPAAPTNANAVTLPSPTPSPTVRVTKNLVPPIKNFGATAGVPKTLATPRGWRIQPISVRHQVGAIATRWKVSPPGRIRHTLEITVANVSNSWQVDVKAHHQDGAWLTGVLANTTPLSQSFSQHGWDLSQVSLWLGQSPAGGNGGQLFGQGGHSPPEPQFQGYGSGNASSDARRSGNPQDGINYTA